MSFFVALALWPKYSTDVKSKWIDYSWATIKLMHSLCIFSEWIIRIACVRHYFQKKSDFSYWWKISQSDEYQFTNAPRDTISSYFFFFAIFTIDFIVHNFQSIKHDTIFYFALQPPKKVFQALPSTYITIIVVCVCMNAVQIYNIQNWPK